MTTTIEGATEFAAHLSFADTHIFDPTNRDDLDARHLYPTTTLYRPDSAAVQELVANLGYRHPGFLLVLEGLDRTGLGFRVTPPAKSSRLPGLMAYDLKGIGTTTVEADTVPVAAWRPLRLCVSRAKQVRTRPIAQLSRYELSPSDRALFDDPARFTPEQMREMHVARSVITAMNVADRHANLTTVG